MFLISHHAKCCHLLHPVNQTQTQHIQHLMSFLCVYFPCAHFKMTLLFSFHDNIVPFLLSLWQVLQLTVSPEAISIPLPTVFFIISHYLSFDSFMSAVTCISVSFTDDCNMVYLGSVLLSPIQGKRFLCCLAKRHTAVCWLNFPKREKSYLHSTVEVLV